LSGFSFLSSGSSSSSGSVATTSNLVSSLYRPHAPIFTGGHGV
jgi:hypothetical protein